MKNGTNDEKRKNYVVVFCKLDPLVKAKGKMCFSSRTHQLAFLKARKKSDFCCREPLQQQQKKRKFPTVGEFWEKRKKKAANRLKKNENVLFFC